MISAFKLLLLFLILKPVWLGGGFEDESCLLGTNVAWLATLGFYQFLSGAKFPCKAISSFCLWAKTLLKYPAACDMLNIALIPGMGNDLGEIIDGNWKYCYPLIMT